MEGKGGREGIQRRKKSREVEKERPDATGHDASKSFLSSPLDVNDLRRIPVARMVSGINLVSDLRQRQVNPQERRREKRSGEGTSKRRKS
jgi:hypothetical protein